jgi:hypothetical protein
VVYTVGIHATCDARSEPSIIPSDKKMLPDRQHREQTIIIPIETSAEPHPRIVRLTVTRFIRTLNLMCLAVSGEDRTSRLTPRGTGFYVTPGDTYLGFLRVHILIIPETRHPTTIVAGDTIHAVVESEDMPLHVLVLPTSKLLVHQDPKLFTFTGTLVAAIL